MHRFRFVLWRPLQLLPVLFGISVITFVLIRLIPGDPARLLLGTRATPSALARIRDQYGLDEPLWTQYLYFLTNLFHGEMGRSIVYKIGVLDLMAEDAKRALAARVATLNNSSTLLGLKRRNASTYAPMPQPMSRMRAFSRLT